MLAVEFCIWLACRTCWAHLTKTIEVQTLPRVGEHMKFHPRILEDYFFSWKVADVIFRENGKIEVWTELVYGINDWMYPFENDSEFYQCLKAYESEGWVTPRGVIRLSQQ